MKAQYLILTVVASLTLAAQASVFEVHVVEQNRSVKTKAYTIENAGRKVAVNLNNEVLIDRSMLAGANVVQEKISVTSGPKPEQKPVPAIMLTFTKDGVNKFTELTTALLGRQVGVLIDGKLIATPEVRGKGLKGNAITLLGNFTKEEADALVVKLNKGK